MTKDIRLLAFDLDDTALNRKKELSPRVKTAIEKAIQAGIVVLPATGRALANIPKEILAIQGIEYALTSNGAKIFELSERKTIYSDCFPLAQAEELWRLVCQYPSSPAMYIDGDAYTETKHFATLAPHIPPQVLEYLKNSRTVVPNLLEKMQEMGQPVEKITIYFDDLAEREKVRKAVEERGDACITSSVAANIEINTLTANKGVSLLALADYLHIPHSQVMAVGDNNNDIEMLQMAGYGVAMENAEDEIKAVADTIAPSCDKDGLAIAIENVL